MPTAQSKTAHEAFARFFEAPSRESLRALLKEHIGELRNCDFKESWPELSNIAKHLLGLANTNGGCLVVGVRENDDKTLSPVGIGLLKDKADIINGVKHYVPAPLLAALEVGDYSFDAAEYAALVGKRFQVLFVHGQLAEIPFVSQRAGNGIRAGAVYVRREGATEEATHEELQALILRRVASMPQTAQARDLKEHLEELKVLFGELPRTITVSSPLDMQLSAAVQALWGTRKPNPGYPKEDYESFVQRLIAEKKRTIERIVGLSTSATQLDQSPR